MQLGEKARCLAVAMQARHPRLPDCPTFKEQGIDLVSGAYRGYAVLKGTPMEVQKKLAELIATINKNPEFIANSASA